MDLFKKKEPIAIDPTELREMQRKINILEHDYDVLNQEMTDIVKKLARVERKVYRNDAGLSGSQADKTSGTSENKQMDFWIPK